ncbi:MAG TPA: Mur ligase family protein, partial [Erysipelothrix sp.]|nr:Mur ligase family protein [Erysipelothrix sp.]
MNKKIKYQSAIIASKLVHRTLKLFGRNSTHMPGHIALKIDPELLKTLPMPQHRLAITGTNGKTSVSNLISAFLRYKQFDVINNSYGSNILQGTTTALLSGTNILGNQTKPWSVLEVDELASRFLLPDYQPQQLIVTNLFRDSYRRNAHVDFIVTRLNQAIGDNTHLLLNGDDLISSMLKPNNARSYFSIRPLPHETSNSDALINDLPICPQCNHPLT